MSPRPLARSAGIGVGPVTAATVAWRYEGRLNVSAIVKATFAFAPDGAMTRVAPQPVVRAEVHHDDNPGRSVRLTTDLVPYLTRADVLVTGHAFVAGGGTAETLAVRLGLFEGARTVLDKAVLVRKAGGFQRMALSLEHAVGGVGVPGNPFGVGIPAGSGEANVLDPHDEKRPACLGPIGQHLAARRGLLRALPQTSATGVMEVPADLDWAYFQAALPDQRVDFLRGDEWLVMDGMHPTLPRLRTRLPGAVGTARVHGLSRWGVAEGQVLELHADVLRIDTDEQQCTVTFRGAFPLPSEDALGAVRILAAVELPGEPVEWPGLPTPGEGDGEADAIADSKAYGTAIRSRLDGTLVLGETLERIAAGREAVPFRAGSSVPPLALDRTTLDARAPPVQASPSQAHASGPTRPAAVAEDHGAPPRARLSFELTVDAEPAGSAGAVMPFAAPIDPPAQAPPGFVRAAPPPAFAEPASEAATGAAALPVPIAAPLPMKEPPARAEREPPPATPVAAPPIAAPSAPKAPEEVVRKGLYGRFGGKR